GSGSGGRASSPLGRGGGGGGGRKAGACPQRRGGAGLLRHDDGRLQGAQARGVRGGTAEESERQTVEAAVARDPCPSLRKLIDNYPRKLEVLRPTCASTRLPPSAKSNSDRAFASNVTRRKGWTREDCSPARGSDEEAIRLSRGYVTPRALQQPAAPGPIAVLPNGWSRAVQDMRIPSRGA